MASSTDIEYIAPLSILSKQWPMVSPRAEKHTAEKGLQDGNSSIISPNMLPSQDGACDACHPPNTPRCNAKYYRFRQLFYSRQRTLESLPVAIVMTTLNTNTLQKYVRVNATATVPVCVVWLRYPHTAGARGRVQRSDERDNR